jgi:hypothetical protein
VADRLERRWRQTHFWVLHEAEVLSHARDTQAQVSYLIWTPEMARAMINLWISLVPSKMV